MENNDYEEERTEVYKFRSEDGTITSIPRIGKVNCIELQQENRTDWLFTRLPKELALKYSTGKVMTKYGEAIGDKCVIITKFRGTAIDSDDPNKSGECYTLLFTPYYAEKNVDLEYIDEGISDDDIKLSLMALDDSKGLYWRNQYLRESVIHSQERDYYEKKDYDYRASVTRTATRVTDAVDVGEGSVENDIRMYDIKGIKKWLMQNSFWVIVGIGVAIFMFYTMFRGG